MIITVSDFKTQTLQLRNVALLLFCVAMTTDNKISLLLDFILFVIETNESYAQSESRRKKLFMYVVLIMNT